ncbi:putative alpha-amylase [Aureobasidium pullulans]|nr:putative alpha-amylase [Aureobasidium pullulans]
MHFRRLTSFLVTFAAANGLSPSEWRPQSIYQVMTDRFARTDGSTTASCDLGDYCGGTWTGLINELDYIQNMGFTAVWISPVVKNLDALTADGSSYHGYWAQDIYEVNTNFGSAADLVSLSDALHKRGMYLMVDIVTNHMGYAGCGDCVDYSTFNPFDKKSYYHPFCLIDYNNQTSMELCWEGDNTVSLPDLRTEDTTVQDMWATWIKQLVANYTIDGLRIDSTAEVDKASLKAFESAAGIYAIGEVFNNNADYVCGYQGSISGLMNYPLYYNITSAFKQHFSGSSTPKNREALWTSGYNTAATLYKHIAKLNAIRKLAIEKDEGYLTYNAYPVWTDEHTIVMRKGGNVTQIIGIFNNLGSSGNANLTLLATSSGFDAEMEVVDLLACEKFTTDGKGDLDVGIKGGVPVVLYSVLQIEGSGLCES